MGGRVLIVRGGSHSSGRGVVPIIRGPWAIKDFKILCQWFRGLQGFPVAEGSLRNDTPDDTVTIPLEANFGTSARASLRFKGSKKGD